MRVIIGNVQTPANPLLRAVSIVVGAIALVAALFFGALVLAFVIGFLLIVGSIAALRFWWISRKFRKAATGSYQRADTSAGRSSEGSSSGGRIIEGEFDEVRDQDRDQE